MRTNNTHLLTFSQQDNQKATLTAPLFLASPSSFIDVGYASEQIRDDYAFHFSAARSSEGVMGLFGKKH